MTLEGGGRRRSIELAGARAPGSASGELRGFRLPRAESEPVPPDGRDLLRRSLDCARSQAVLDLVAGSAIGVFALGAAALAIVGRRYLTEQVADSAELLLRTRSLPDHGSVRDLFLPLPVGRDLTVRELIAAARRTAERAFDPETEQAARAGAADPGEIARVGCFSQALHAEAAGLGDCDAAVTVSCDDRRIQLRIEVDAAACSARIAECLVANTAQVLGNLPSSLDRALDEVDCSSDQERRLLAELSRGAEMAQDARTVASVFSRQARACPDRRALLFPGGELSYRDLDQQSERLVAALAARGTSRGDTVAMLLANGPQAVVAMLGIAKLGACYVPVRPEDPERRKRQILADCGARVLVTSRAQRHAVPADLSPSTVVLEIEDDHLWRALPPARVEPCAPSDLLYVMYTSGTTGAPKGVMVEHRGVVRLADRVRWVRLEAGQRLLRTAPLEFDAATFEVWGSLFNGLTLCMPEADDLLSAERFRTRLEQWRIDVLWLTAPLFHRLATADPAIFGGLKTLVAGGSRVSSHHVARVRAACPGLLLVNGYGPTENTTFSTTYQVTRDWRDRLPIGRPIDGSTAYVVDGCGRLQPIGVAGELYVGGAGVARGYLNDPVLTAERFVSLEATGERVYKTGDLARWLPDGNLDFLGRRDEQVKVRGYRIEPQEVEAQLERCAGVRDAAVVSRSTGDDDVSLHAFAVAPGTTPDQLRSRLAERLPAYMIPETIDLVDALPLTATGKVDRRALAAAHSRRRGSGAFSDDGVGRLLGCLWEEILDVEDVGAEDNFFDFGGHSMKALELLTRIHKELGVSVSLQDFLAAPTPGEVLRLVREADATPHESIAPAPAAPWYELSVSQRRIAELYAGDRRNTAFNINLQTELPPGYGERAARAAVEALVRRHASLRTRIRCRDGVWVQYVEERPPVTVEHEDLSALEPAAAEARAGDLVERRAAMPFDLEQGPPYRILFLETADRLRVLWNVHHVVADGWSMNVLSRDLVRLYEQAVDGTGEPSLEPLRLQFYDYVAWHNSLLADAERTAPARRYWQNVLAPPLDMLPLPWDHPPEELRVGMASAGLHFVVDEVITRELKRLARGQSTTLFMALFAGFFVLLSEISGRDDVLTGIPSANRNNDDLRDVVGFFVDSVLVRCPVHDAEDFPALLRRVTARTLRALEHAFYPIELACEVVDTTWPRVLSTFFNMSTFGDVNRRRLEDHSLRHESTVQPSKLPLVFYLTEYVNGVDVEVHYYRELFEPRTIEGFVRRYLAILEHACRLPSAAREKALAGSGAGC